jgi:hypothetical protein
VRREYVCDDILDNLQKIDWAKITGSLAKAITAYI